MRKDERGAALDEQFSINFQLRLAMMKTHLKMPRRIEFDLDFIDNQLSAAAADWWVDGSAL